MQPHAKRRLLVIVAVIVVVWAALVAILVTAHHRLDAGGPTVQASPTPPPTSGKLPVLWNLPAFSFVDQRGTTVTDQSLRGRVLITDFIFTRCTTVCPLITAKMNLLRRSIARPDVRFVSFSVDPDYDKPDKLAAYATRWKGDSRWILLSTTDSGLHDVARDMKVTVAKSDDPDNPIIHSSLFFLVDGEGRVRGVYNSDDDAALKRLAAEAATLERTSASAPAKPPPEDADRAMTGMQLFQSVGCAGCHDNPHIAPALGGLSGSQVALQGGKTLVADAAYIRRSIVDPAAEVATGFSLSMPVYRGHLTDAQIDALATYIASLPAPAPAPPGSAAPAPEAASDGQKVVDPVCGMQVVTGNATAHAEHDGKTYWFCSDLCRDRFVKDPAKYAKP